MSVQAIGWVLEHSDATQGDRLVLIAIANHAHADGTNAFAAIETYAYEAHLSERQVRRCLRNLEESGEIVETGRTKAGTHIYAIPKMGGDILSPGFSADHVPPRASAAISGPSGGTPTTPEPSEEQKQPLESSETSSPHSRATSEKPQHPHPPDELFEAVVTVCHGSAALVRNDGKNALTKDERGRVNAAVAQLRAIGATPEQVRRAAVTVRSLWPQVAVTPQTLTANWNVLLKAGRPPERRVSPPEPEPESLPAEENLARIKALAEEIEHAHQVPAPTEADGFVAFAALEPDDD